MSNQPKVVKQAVGTFMRSLLEGGGHRAGGELPLSLGWRAGAVVALTIPFVLLSTFLAMQIFSRLTCIASQPAR